MNMRLNKFMNMAIDNKLSFKIQITDAESEIETIETIENPINNFNMRYNFQFDGMQTTETTENNGTASPLNIETANTYFSFVNGPLMQLLEHITFY